MRPPGTKWTGSAAVPLWLGVFSMLLLTRGLAADAPPAWGAYPPWMSVEVERQHAGEAPGYMQQAVRALTIADTSAGRCAVVCAFDEGGARAVPVVPQLLRLATDATPAVLTPFALQGTKGDWAIQALAKIKDPALAPLLGALASDDPQIRAAAARALGALTNEIGTRPVHTVAADPLRQAMKDRNAHVRYAAAYALGLTGDARALDVLREGLRRGTPQERAQCATALADVDVPAARDALFRAMEGRDPMLRDTAANALAIYINHHQFQGDEDQPLDPALRARLMDALHSRNPDLRTAAAMAFSHGDLRHDDPAYPALAAALQDPVPAVRIVALRAVAPNGWGPGGPDVAVLVPALTDPDVPVRREAVTVFGRYTREQDRPDLVSPLLPALRDPDVEVRRAAARALASVPPSQHAPRPDRQGEETGLAKVTIPGWQDAMLQALQDPDEQVRAQAALGLARTGLAAGLDVLIRASRSKEADLARTGILGLSLLPDPRAAEAALAAIREADPSIRAAVVYVLSALPAPQAHDALLELVRDPSYQVRRDALRELVQHPFSEAIPTLLGALTDEHPQVRQQAVEAARVVPKGEAVPALYNLLSWEQDETVRIAAYQTIAYLAYPPPNWRPRPVPQTAP